MELVGQRGPDKTICPSEAARAVNPEKWRPLMDRARDAARELSDDYKITIEQNGQQVYSTNLSGPIRLRLKNNFVL